MWSEAVVPIQIAHDRSACFVDRVIGMQIHLFIFDRLPETFHKDIVSPGSTTIHAQFASSAFHRLDKFFGSELAALIGVDDLRGAVAVECFLQYINGMAYLQGYGTLAARTFRLAQSTTAVR